jgi:predicted Zn-dependent protease
MLQIVIILGVIAMVAFGASGCDTRMVYPGLGQLIIVDIEPNIDSFPVTHPPGSIAKETVGEAVRQGIRYWDYVGVRFRTLDQLEDSDIDDVPSAPHLIVTSQPVDTDGDARFTFDDGKIHLFLDKLVTKNVNTQQWSWLVGTIAHEAGHAIGLDHVDDPSAVMYPHNNLKNVRNGLAPADVVEYDRVWGQPQK